MRLFLFTLVALLSTFVAIAEEPYRLVEWNFSAENSYPQDGTVNTPKLAKQMAQVIKFNAGDPFSSDCQKAIQRFGYAYSQFADNFELYAHVPTCNLGERGLILIGKLIDEKREGLLEDLYKFEGESFDALHVFFQRGNYYFERELAGSSNVNLLKAGYDFRIAYAGFTYATKMVTTFKQTIQDGKQQKLKAEYEKRMNEYHGQITNEANIELVRRILALEPENKRFKGILGSLLIRGSGASGFGEARLLLEPLCGANIYKQACDDLGQVK